MKKLSVFCSVAAFAVAAALPGAAQAQAIIDNGTIQLGVDTLGQLNVPDGAGDIIGLTDLRTGFESTSPGCLCEGWGVAVQGTGISGFANNATGTGGLALVSFVSTASTATSIVNLTTGPLTVTHNFTPSTTPNLYQVDVTILNTGAMATSGSLLYRRTFDWDVEPTAFDEYVTIGGTAGAANVLAANNNGFCDSNPLTGCGSLGATGDFTDVGAFDHGANFDFIFDPLGAGESQTLTIFYGAALSETSAFASLSSVGAEVFSFGQSNDNIDGNTPDRSTFMFGFKGVGGTVVPEIPEPSTWAMLILGFGLIGSAMRRRRGAAITVTA